MYCKDLEVGEHSITDGLEACGGVVADTLEAETFLCLVGVLCEAAVLRQPGGTWFFMGEHTGSWDTGSGDPSLMRRYGNIFIPLYCRQRK